MVKGYDLNRAKEPVSGPKGGQLESSHLQQQNALFRTSQKLLLRPGDMPQWGPQGDVSLSRLQSCRLVARTERAGKWPKKTRNCGPVSTNQLPITNCFVPSHPHLSRALLRPSIDSRPSALPPLLLPT